MDEYNRLRRLYAPHLGDLKATAGEAGYYASLDLESAYWQTGMSNRAKEKSAFCTRRGLFQFRRMSFGLTGAPATFCRLMQKVLGNYLWKICLCFLDDIIIFARTQRELLERLYMVLTRL